MIDEEFIHELIRPSELIDIYVKQSKKSLDRTYTILEPGFYRLCRQDCELKSVSVLNVVPGSLKIFTANGRKLYDMPSIFTGSFYIGAGSENGLLVKIYTDYKRAGKPNVKVAWREKYIDEKNLYQVNNYRVS